MARSRTRRAVLWLVAATPLLAACNAILGISDFEKAECPGGGACLDDGGTSSSSSSGGFDAGDAQTDGPITIVDARGADPVSWAQNPMPNYPTGAADSGPNVNLESLTVAKDSDGKTDIVVDAIAKLTWRKVPESERNDVTWDVAKTTCPAGYRLPTRIELVTLLNLDPKKTPVRAADSLGLQATKYWTTSLERTNNKEGNLLITSKHWVVSFAAGSDAPVARIEESLKASVICVKAK